MARNSFPMKLDFSRVQNMTTAANSLTFPNAMGPQTYGVLITALANTWVYFGGAAQPVSPLPRRR